VADRVCSTDKDIEMGIVRFALRFPYTFYVLAAFIVFLGVSAITVMPEDIFPEINIPLAVQQNIVRNDGQRSVLLNVLKNGNASTVAVVNGVRKVLQIARAARAPHQRAL
jgi:multidrug efflux pump subunit AcrB